MICNRNFTALLFILSLQASSEAWMLTPSSQPPRTTRQSSSSCLSASDQDSTEPLLSSRRGILLNGLATTAASLLIVTTANPEPSLALVKGNAPPPKKSAGGADNKPKCTNVEECQAAAEKREQEEREKREEGRSPAQMTSTGIRYLDIEDGSGAEVKDGDNVQVYYKVLKLGKRSYDGLSGEGTVVFSRGRLFFLLIQLLLLLAISLLSSDIFWGFLKVCFVFFDLLS